MFGAARAGLVSGEHQSCLPQHRAASSRCAWSAAARWCLRRASSAATTRPCCSALIPELDRAAARPAGVRGFPGTSRCWCSWAPDDLRGHAVVRRSRWPPATDVDAARSRRSIEEQHDPDQVFNIQFTSGTTGTPKGATLTHFNIVNNGFFVGEGMRLSAADRVCIPVPLYHCFGMVLGVLAAMTHGAASVLSRRWLRAAGGARDGGGGALHGVARRADDVHRGTGAPAVRRIRSVVAAHRHHGRLALSRSP